MLEWLGGIGADPNDDLETRKRKALLVYLAVLILPIGLALIQLGLWPAIAIAILLIVIQQFIGIYVEPRMAGAKLGVSPLLIILSLSFWGVVWGIPGMILAVPLLVTVKIVLDNIAETKPLATLMSNM